jgi:hypothetical protein
LLSIDHSLVSVKNKKPRSNYNVRINEIMYLKKNNN